MPDSTTSELRGFLAHLHPYDSLSAEQLERVAEAFELLPVEAGSYVYRRGDPLAGLYLIRSGCIEVSDGNGGLVSILGPRNSFGERGLMRDGLAMTTARAAEPSELLCLPAAEFRRLLAESETFERFFRRGGTAPLRGLDLSALKVRELIARAPVACEGDISVAEAARRMREARVSCLGVVDGERLVGLVTTRDLCHRVLAEDRSAETPVAAVMTRDPVTLGPEALGSDLFSLMLERRIGHLPIVEGGRLLGMVTQTDLTRFQAVSSARLIREIASANDPAQLAECTAQIPQLLVQLVGSQQAHEVVTRLITDIADAATRRLLLLAEAELGPPPVPYLWLACGSQGRREQTGVSDQDNCLIIDDGASDEDLGYFEALARYVCDGLNAAGYVYCPGEMMASNPRWRQRLRTWRQYFRGWIDTPSPEAQMLASVMFDLRPIGGQTALFDTLQAETLAAASQNSIFVAHLISNALKHSPPLGLLRGFATIRSGEYKNHVDLKHSGVIPVVDLARVYALRGRLPVANTRARLTAAGEAGIISASGCRDLVQAYDMIASIRLKTQAAQIRAGRKPDNYLAPAELSDFERSHLRDAFVVVRTMQSALGHGKGVLG